MPEIMIGEVMPMRIVMGVAVLCVSDAASVEGMKATAVEATAKARAQTAVRTAGASRCGVDLSQGDAETNDRSHDEEVFHTHRFPSHARPQ